MQAASLSEQRSNVSSVAEELGICKKSIINWRKFHKEGKFTKARISLYSLSSLKYDNPLELLSNHCNPVHVDASNA
ncbi:helix-turn-helix domain-containing protein [Chryseobacterium ginsenosidimutans]|uniref:helix-turn-helix domain-containing protein n=1 Tax=Chryseobacterium ginsenosidimutans TaxID=687846 RepID=UPI003CD09C80